MATVRMVPEHKTIPSNSNEIVNFNNMHKNTSNGIPCTFPQNTTINLYDYKNKINNEYFLNFLSNSNYNINNWEFRIRCLNCDISLFIRKEIPGDAVYNTEQPIFNSEDNDTQYHTKLQLDDGSYLHTVKKEFFQNIVDFEYFNSIIVKSQYNAAGYFYGSEFYIEYDNTPIQSSIEYMGNSVINIENEANKILKTKGTIVENNIILNNSTYNIIYDSGNWNYVNTSSISFPTTPNEGDIYAAATNEEIIHQWTESDLQWQ